MKKSYLELLKDPRWQKKRLEVMEKHNFKCENCGDSKSTLHVHHGYYEKGKKPWEYEERMLHCLCDGCHSNRHYWEDTAKKIMAALPVEKLAEVVDAYCEVTDIF